MVDDITHKKLLAYWTVINIAAFMIPKYFAEHVRTITSMPIVM